MHINSSFRIVNIYSYGVFSLNDESLSDYTDQLKKQISVLAMI